MITCWKKKFHLFCLLNFLWNNWNGDGKARAFEYAPEYGDIRGDTFLLDCP